MGSWAPGNFENDGALDYLGEVVDSFEQRIEEILADEWRVSIDEEVEAVLMPSVQVISLLCEHCNCAPPKTDIIQGWRVKYLGVFDSQIDGLDPQADYKAERRAVIAATFDKLEKQSRDFWK